MSHSGERTFIAGGAGRIETVINRPDDARGVALVAHPQLIKSIVKGSWRY